MVLLFGFEELFGFVFDGRGSWMEIFGGSFEMDVWEIIGFCLGLELVWVGEVVYVVLIIVGILFGLRMVKFVWVIGLIWGRVDVLVIILLFLFLLLFGKGVIVVMGLEVFDRLG